MSSSPGIVFVGLDVHKEFVTCAPLASDAAGDAAPSTATDEIPFDLPKLRRYLDRLAAGGAAVRCVYEASGGGYVLQRAIAAWGHHCDVCAPSLTPQRPGHRRKHNRYDARQLARYYRSGELVLIRIPTAHEEQLREVVRCRTTFQRTLHRARQQVLKWCTRHGQRFVPVGTRGCHWTGAHRAWLERLRAAPERSAGERLVLGELLALMEYAEGRRDALDRELRTLLLDPALRPAVATLTAFRGLEAVAALVLGTEIVDWRRFTKGSQPMAYVGLVPREHSSAKDHRGSITKMGNSHCRHVLVQAAWAYRHPPKLGRALRARQAGADPRVVALSWKAQHRLHRLYRHVAAKRGSKVAVVAVARELTGFLWAAMVLPPQAAAA